MSEAPKYNYTLPVLLATCLCVGLAIGHFMGTPYQGKSNEVNEVKKLEDILSLLDERYVDKVNKDSIFEATIGEMLHKLDPHSNYIPAKDMLALNESIEAKFGGVGIRFFILRDTICVSNIIAGSPSEKLGILSGDRIIEIDGKKVAGKKITNEKVMSQLKGQPGTKVKVLVKRGKQNLPFSIERGIIPISTVSCSFMVDATTGYILIDQFSIPTAKEFRSAASKLLEKGMKHLILDLRNNGGGVLTAATDIADEFLEEGNVILKTKGRKAGEQIYKAKNGGLLEKTNVVVLINSGSASASEILAGALQDNDRAYIVGRRSFGKGLVQEDRQLRDGSNLRLTIARYYTPSGRCIQRPYKGDYESYLKDEDRYERGEMFQLDTSSYGKSEKFKTKGGRIVYGGGGITPDVFVPFDTSGSSMYLSALRWSGSINAFAFDFVNGKRKKWNNPAYFQTEFQADDNLLKTFTLYAQKNYEVIVDPQGLKVSRGLLSVILKAEIARQLWTEEGFYRVYNAYDEEFKAALKKLRSVEK
jgi:carboxyl-terminal processing protease